MQRNFRPRIRIGSTFAARLLPATSYLRKTVGVSRLRKVHGTGKNRGMRPSHHYNGSGSVDRKAIQALAKLQILELDDNTGGRRITAQGQRDLDRIALTVAEAAADDDSSDA
ncbi:40S ribosomal protein S19 protein [Pyrenophora tritici-repentis]|nr:40S ribosomal protein S19 protein [Pyrenophora tritici-repentis]KAG9382840.1 40S ribosomal protein S19 protein [Pyrenophora tritici-repentis]KAI0570405.1 40S ribosomal protein S19-like protein [Pyrenophora tritici-repentis]KAI0616558.1 40S ribosomal protein S19-like protein [Pyrenophora tritici-repentis]KAI1523847.1 RPS19A Ribosomal protein S19E S16A [Pyrenophora tritici-repentis]